MSSSIEILSELQRAQCHISDLLSDTEKDFLLLGNKLAVFTTLSNNVLQNAKSSASILASDEMQNLIDHLNEILARNNRYIKFNSTQLEKKLSSFDNILGNIQNSLGPLKNIEKRTLELKTLGILTRIENAHLSSNNPGFATLSIDINSLSNEINNKVEMIQDGLINAQRMVKRAYTQILSCKNKQDECSHTIFGNISSCIQSLSEKHTQSIELVQTVMNDNKNITNRVYEIIGSLQIHDITRQKLEHVNSAITCIKNTVEKSKNPLDKKNYIKIADVCHLQIRQLSQTRKDLLQAIHSLITNSQAIIKKSKHMTLKTQNLIESSDKQSLSFSLEIENGLKSVVSSLRENAVIIIEMEKTIQKIAGIVEQMSTFIQEIKEIGTNISLLALNAIINAEHLHNEGKVLSVLGEGIQQLAVQTKAEIKMLSLSLANINQYAEKMSKGTNEKEQEKTINTIVDNMSSSLDDISLQLNQILQDATKYLNSVKSDGEAFQQDFQLTVSQINVHKIFNKKIIESVDLLTITINKICIIVPDYYEKEREVNTNDLINNYTMHSERLVHDKFTKIKKDNSSKNANKGHDDLGENIELF